jgi:hypothetical protein
MHCIDATRSLGQPGIVVHLRLKKKICGRSREPDFMHGMTSETHLVRVVTCALDIHDYKNVGGESQNFRAYAKCVWLMGVVE